MGGGSTAKAKPALAEAHHQPTATARAQQDFHRDALPFEQAVAAAREAIELVRKHGQPNLVTEVSNHLALYQKRVPHHEP